MYRFSYSEVLEDTPASARERERIALEHCITLLEAADEKGPRSREAIEAIYFSRRLWAMLLEDLASPENQLPEQLRASLISIGLWIMRETEAIRLGNSQNYKGVSDVCRTIATGLQ
jgi:flagellar protein FlaF